MDSIAPAEVDSLYIQQPADTVPDFISILVSSLSDEDPEAETTDVDVNENVKDNDNLSFLVKTFYVEPRSREVKPEDVLGFLTDAYSEHDFHESGSWVKDSPHYRYIPYKGELPDYSYADFRMPVAGKLTSVYGYREKWHRMHYGIDIALNHGDTVRCALPGVVTRTGHDRRGYGNYVVVAHSGGVETLYGHLGAAIVKPGDKLKPGSPLGLGGSTGNSTGPHLHFETRRLGVAMDPVSWFNLQDRLR